MLSSPIIAEPPSGGAPKRRSSRQRIETLVYADFGPGNGGFPINLSEGGMAFQGIQPLEKDRVIHIRLKLPGTNNAVETSGRIVWLNELGTGGGLEFVDLPDEFRGPIVHWMALQTQTGNSDEKIPAGTQQFERKEFRPTPPIPSQVQYEYTSPQAATKSAVQAPRPVLSPAPAAPATANGKATSGLLRFTDSAQAVPRGAEKKRTWIKPFSIGVICCAAIMVAIMVVFGVISVQLHLPQKTAVENAALQADAPGRGKPPQSPSEKTPDNEPATDRLAANPSGFVASTAAESPVSKGKPAETSSKATEPSPVKTAAVSKIEPPPGALQKVAAAKLKAPRSKTSAGPAEIVPPAEVLPTMPEPTLQLPAISARTAAPAPPVSAAARQSGKFDEPRLVTRIDPIYPALAKTAGVSGSVKLQFTITADGRVRDVIAIEGNRMLVGAAVQALQSWRYQPARLNGIPVEAQSSTKFNFKAH